jgi:hypothetical protein
MAAQRLQPSPVTSPIHPAALRRRA